VPFQARVEPAIGTVPIPRTGSPAPVDLSALRAAVDDLPHGALTAWGPSEAACVGTVLVIRPRRVAAAYGSVVPGRIWVQVLVARV
jgi:hypothetical protein